MNCSCYLNHIGFVPHSSNLGHVSHLLLHQRRLEGDEHEEGKDAVVPVLVQTPQPHAKHLHNTIHERDMDSQSAGVS